MPHHATHDHRCCGDLIYRVWNSVRSLAVCHSMLTPRFEKLPCSLHRVAAPNRYGPINRTILSLTVPINAIAALQTTKIQKSVSRSLAIRRHLLTTTLKKIKCHMNAVAARAPVIARMHAIVRPRDIVIFSLMTMPIQVRKLQSSQRSTIGTNRVRYVRTKPLCRMSRLPMSIPLRMC